MSAESLTPTCANAECDRRPTHYVRIGVPAVGYPRDRCLHLICGIALCREHAEAETAEEWLADADFRDKVTAATRLISVVPPDFARGWIEARRFDDAWRKFLAMRADSSGGGRA